MTATYKHFGHRIWKLSPDVSEGGDTGACVGRGVDCPDHDGDDHERWSGGEPLKEPAT